MRPSPVDPRLDQPPTSDLKARALIAAIPDPIFRIGTDGVYRGFKVDSEEDLLTSPDDVLGKSIYDRLPRDVEGVLDVLERVLRDRAASGGEHGVGDVLRQPLVDGPPEDVVGGGQEVGLAVDLEPAVDAVRPDPEDRIGDRGDQRPCLQVARGRLVEPRIDGRRTHSTLVARSPVETRLSPPCTCPQNGPVGRGRGRPHRRERVSRARS